MSGLPKIVLQRLRAQPATQPAAGGPAGRVRGEGIAHPDANLLSAFVEKTLAPHEQKTILDHLARCGDCREIISLSQPAEVQVEQRAIAAAPGRARLWPILRWGALAAALGSGVIAVTLRRHPLQPRTNFPKQTQPVLEAARRSPRPVQYPPAAFDQRQQPPPVAANAQSHRAADESAKLEAELAAPAGKQLSAGLVPGQNKQQPVTLMAAARPSATPVPLLPPRGASFQARQNPAPSNAAGEGLVLALPKAPSSGAPSSPAQGASAAFAPAAPSDAQAPLIRAAPQLAVQPKTAKVATAESPTGDLASSAGAVSPRVASAPPAREPAAVRVESHAVELMGARTRGTLKTRVSLPTPRWSISSEGALRRSDDKGRSWVEVQIDSSVKLCALAADGSEVWVGGAEGALYHSSDAGANWKRVSLGPVGVFTETIANIQLRDPQRLAVATSSGQQWSTENGGETWQKEP